MTDGPSDEQLARFACVCVFGVLDETQLRSVEALFEQSPIVRDVWLERHAAFQRHGGRGVVTRRRFDDVAQLRLEVEPPAANPNAAFFNEDGSMKRLLWCSDSARLGGPCPYVGNPRFEPCCKVLCGQPV